MRSNPAARARALPRGGGGGRSTFSVRERGSPEVTKSNLGNLGAQGTSSAHRSKFSMQLAMMVLFNNIRNT